MANYLLILSGVISCIILIGFNLLLSRDLLNPINTLVSNIKSFENNDILTPVSVERTDELVSILYDIAYDMTDKIHELNNALIMYTINKIKRLPV